jgi:hypothetical protein
MHQMAPQPAGPRPVVTMRPAATVAAPQPAETES